MEKTVDIIINGKTYIEASDIRFVGCEFCDVRIKDYEYYIKHCVDKSKQNAPCKGLPYLVLKNTSSMAAKYATDISNYVAGKHHEPLKNAFIAGAEYGYEQAEKDLMEKFKMWVAHNGYTAQESELVYNDFKQFITEN